MSGMENILRENFFAATKITRNLSLPVIPTTAGQFCSRTAATHLCSLCSSSGRRKAVHFMTMLTAGMKQTTQAISSLIHMAATVFCGRIRTESFRMFLLMTIPPIPTSRAAITGWQQSVSTSMMLRGTVCTLQRIRPVQQEETKRAAAVIPVSEFLRCVFLASC